MPPLGVVVDIVVVHDIPGKVVVVDDDIPDQLLAVEQVAWNDPIAPQRDCFRDRL